MKKIKKTKDDSVDIEGGPKIEPEVKLEDSNDSDPVADKSLEDRTKKVAAREEAVESKMKEINETQELFRKEWDEKVEEIDSLKELHETSNNEIEDVDFNEDDKDENDDDDKETKPEAPAENAPLETGFENLVKKEMKDERVFREKLLKGQEKLEQKFADRELDETLDKAEETHPDMDRREVLLEIQRDPTQDISKLAEKSAKDSQAKKETMKEELKVELKKEADGEKKETEKAETIPSEPVGEANPTRQEKSKDRWSQATKEAQGDMAEGI